MSNALAQILADPSYHDYLGILKGARNGLVYGVKVRFPHALIMAILFGRGEYVQPAPMSKLHLLMSIRRLVGLLVFGQSSAQPKLMR